MKTIITTTVLAALILTLAGCRTTGSQADAEAWLNSQTGSPGINISGNWYSDDWGSVVLRQSGRHVSGKMDGYQVKGVVSDGSAYLTTLEKGRAYYAIVLSSLGQNALRGNYTGGPAFDPKQKQRPIELRRSY